MVSLPTRQQLADRLDKLERDLVVATAGVGVGYTLARSPAARSAALTGLARLSPYGLAIDALIREEESLAFRAGEAVSSGIVGLAEGVERRSREEGLTFITPPPFVKPKRRTSKFNRAVKAGMAVVKASTSYGAKGKISNSKKAFAAVTKTVSKIKRGAKIAKSGITRKIGLAIKGILK